MSQSQNKPFKIYKASAGSGKTFTIVKEYLTLCLGNNSDAYREILAVTFTNKAAGEMKAKILRFLLGIIEGSKSNDIVQMRNHLIKANNIDENELVSRAKQLYVNMLHSYSDMAVCTIDSFVQRLSRSFAKELELPGQYSVMLDKDDLVDAVIQLLSDEIGKDTYITKVMLHYVEFNLSEETDWNVKKLLSSFIKKLLNEDAYLKGNYKNIKPIDEAQYNEIISYVHPQNVKIQKSIKASIDKIEAKENELGIKPSDYNGKESRGLPSVKKKINAGENVVTTATINSILNGSKSWKGDKCKINDDSIVGLYKEAVDNYNSLNTKRVVLGSIESNIYLYILRNHIYELIKKYIDETAQVHISEFNKRISDILGDCSVPFIYERIGEKYSNYFVDEFQDTSVLQWHNFLPLIHNSLSSNKMNMVVGDAKQSIYRFRSGDVEQIIELPQIYKCPDNNFGAECQSMFERTANKLSLDTNFRSMENVVKFNNTFFRYAEKFLTLKGIFNDAEQKYNPANKGGFVCVEVLHGTKNDNKTRIKASMLDKIKELHSQGVDYKDITILVTANADGVDISDYLVANGIDVVSAESVLLQTSDKIQLIINTLSLMVDDKNPVAKKAIEYFVKKCDVKNSFVPADIAQRVHLGGIYDVCMQICDYCGFNIVTDVFLEYFMNTVYEWQCHHSTGIADFLDFWNKKKSKLAVQINSDLDCVNVMTVHKAKGLEFKVVMYPYANTTLKRSNTKSEVWIPCAADEYAKKIPHLDSFLLKYSKVSNTAYAQLAVNEANKTELDTIDVMYVAMTRAKDMLFVYTQDDRPKDGYNLFTDFFADSLDIQHVKSDNDDPEFNDYFVKNDEIKEIKGKDTIYYNYGDFDATLLKVKEKDKKTDDKILELKEGEEAPKPLKWEDKLTFDPDPTMLWAEKDEFKPDEWGSLVHQILSRIKTIDDAERALRPYVNDGTIDKELAEKLLETFRKVTEIPELKPAFADDAIVKNEMDIHTYDGRIIRPDRYAETKNGIILIDYKTGSEHEQYFNQLRDYMSALMQMNGNQTIKAYLVYLGDEIRLVEVKMDRLF